MKLSVLDLIPVRGDQTTAQALHASKSLVGTADTLGYTRYWVAEHHNMPAVASTTPPVIIALLAGVTDRIRVGSGGVMLPNHAPLSVAEDFAMLEAAFPGRIDLGIGRAPGSDQVTAWTLRGGQAGVQQDAVAQFPQYVEQVMAMVSEHGARLAIGPRHFDVRATPVATGTPPVWLLGSSDYSARLAAEKGLPYVFAHHFAGQGTREAIELYRSQYRGPGEPRTFLTANVVVAETAEAARRQALPQQHMMATLRTGAPLRTMMSVEEAEATPSPLPEPMLTDMTRSWFVGTPDDVAGRLRDFAAEFGVDEVMVQPVAGEFEGAPADRTVAREFAVSQLAARLLG